MKMTKMIVTMCVLLTVALSSGTASAVVLFSDDFSGAGSGTGFSDSWDGGTYTDGQLVLTGPTGTEKVYAYRTLSTTIDTATMDFWMSIDMTITGTASGWGGFSIFAGTTEDFFVGSDSASATWEFDTQGYGDQTSTVPNFTGVETHVLVHITADSVQMWIDPDMADLGAADKEILSTDTTSYSPWTRVRIGTSRNIKVNELVAATTYAEIPEPATPVIDDCASAGPVYLDTPVSDSTAGATGSTGIQNSRNDVWYYFDADFTGEVDVSLLGSSFDPVLVILDACGGNLVAANDDDQDYDDEEGYRAQYNNILQSHIEHLYVQQGRRYMISVGGYMGATGNYTLEITQSIENPQESRDIIIDGRIDLLDLAAMGMAWLSDDAVADIAAPYGIVDLNDQSVLAAYWLEPTNFTCDQAALIAMGQTVNGSTLNSYGTVRELDPHLYPDFANLNWYKFQPATSETVVIEVTSCDFDAALCVQDQCRGTVIAFNDDYSGELKPSIEMSVVSGNTYYIAVGGFYGAQGGYTLSITSN